MRFICNESKMEVLKVVASELMILTLNVRQYVELDDPRLISIAQALGMEELAPGNVEYTSSGLEFYRDGIRLPIRVDSPAPENDADMPACEICGKPVQSKRAKTCSEECTREKQRRYAREYYHRKDQPTEDAGGGDDPSPLSPVEEGAATYSNGGWGSDPGDESVRAGAPG